jgi:hypothetical protein
LYDTLRASSKYYAEYMLTLSKNRAIITNIPSLLKVSIVAIAVSAISISTLSESASAISLIGNTTVTGSGSTLSDPINSTTLLLAKFTIASGADSYRLDSVTLNLSNYDQSNDIVKLSIYSGTTGSGNPQKVRVSNTEFIAPTVDFLSSFVPTQFVFNVTASTNFVFTPNDTYWLGVTGATGTTTDWVNSDAGNIAPSSSITGVSFDQYKKLPSGSPSAFGAFDIGVTPVPFEFEASGGILMLAGLLAANKLRKSIQKNNPEK